tara:strand:+ start:1747 stop:2295 length:549 start_codon:yes stop_codon:yes gene_type:complete
MIGVILGGSITNKGKIPKDALSRVKKGLKLFKKGQVDFFMVSGGFMSQKFPRLSEAKLFKDFLVKHGVPKSKIIMENRSRDTLGNAIFCKKIFIKKKLEKNITLITSDYHLKRALSVFRHIFGKRYKIVGVKSKPFIIHKVQNAFAELESYGLDEFFLSQVPEGKHQKAEKLLYLQHNMYKR